MTDGRRTAAIAVLAVLAVALAAATLGSTVTSEPTGGDDTGSGPGAEGGGILPVQQGSPETGTYEVPVPRQLLAAIALLAAVATLVWAIRFPAEAIRQVVTILAIVASLALVVAALVALAGNLALSNAGRNGSILGGGAASGEIAPGAPPPFVVLAVVGLAVVGVFLAFLGSTDRPSTDSVAPDPSADGRAGADAAAVARAAGRAADRIENQADADNEVYRAWREMTALLDVPDPETSTPGEFAAAASDAGLGAADVAELTRLFEDVRYGDVGPSADYERRAVAAFRRIEDRYAGDEA